MVILNDTPQAEANLVASRIRATFEETPLQPDNGDLIRATVSIGIAVKHSDEIAFDSLVSKADQALYEAKHGGRNRVISFVE